MDISIILQVLISGVVLGSIYALVSIGLTLIWGVMNFINFASGQLTMIGMYISFLVVASGLDPLLGLTISTLTLFALGLIIEKTIVVPILKAPRLFQIVITLALALALENSISVIFGNEILSIPKMGSMQFLSNVVTIGPVRISIVKLLVIPVALTLTLSLHWFLTRTRVGTGIRAISQNPYGALLAGVNTSKTYFLTWGLGCAFMGMAGALLALFRPMYPTVGGEFVLVAFFAVTLGGAGSYVGSFISAIFIGVVEALAGFYFVPAIRSVIYICLFVAILIFRPRGLFPTREVG